MSRDQLARAPLAIRGDTAATLASFFESLAPLQATAVVIVDEAHRQPLDVLEQLRALAAHAASAGVLQIVLVAQPSLVETLRTPALRRLDASIARRLELGPLAADEISGYIRHRLGLAGTTPRVEFDEPALQRNLDFVARRSRDRQPGLRWRARRWLQRAPPVTIDAPLVAAAAASLGFERPPGPHERWLRALFIVSVIVALLAAGGFRRGLDVPRCARARGRAVGARPGAAGRSDAAADRADPSARAAARQPSDITGRLIRA